MTAMASREPEWDLDIPELEKLTGKQRAFALAWVGEARFNGTQAARIAGYKGDDNTLCAIGRENLGKPRVRAALNVLCSLIEDRSLTDRRRILENLWSIAEDAGEETKERRESLKLIAELGGHIGRVAAMGQGTTVHAQQAVVQVQMTPQEATRRLREGDHE